MEGHAHSIRRQERQNRLRLPHDVWETCFKFCVVRNPFDKTVSAYECQRKDCSISKVQWLKMKVRYPRMAAEQIRFLSWLKKRGGPDDRDKYLIDDKMYVDFIVRFESLTSDLQRVCTQLCIPWDSQRLQNYKSEYRRRELPLSEYYSAPATGFVKKNYESELVRFGYQVPNEIAQYING